MSEILTCGSVLPYKLRHFYRNIVEKHKIRLTNQEFNRI